MLYTTITVNDTEYKLRLTARASADLERSLGKNPLNFLMEISEDNIPSWGDIAKILTHALQAYQHNITINDVYDLIDTMIDEGKTLEDILPVIIEIFKVSGYFREAKDSKN